MSVSRTATTALDRPLRLSALLIPLAAWVALGVALPLGVLAWLLAHHERPYVLDAAAMASPQAAVGGQPRSLRAAEGVFSVLADDAVTATYADGSTVTFFRTPRPDQAVAKYASTLPSRSMSSYSIGGLTRHDAALADGRFARTFGLEGTVFAFVAPSTARLDRLVAQSAVRENPRRDIGNDVLDDRKAMALAAGFGWFVLTSLVTALAVVRAARAEPVKAA